MALTVVLNGHPRIFESLNESATLDHLIAELGLKGDRVAVEHNGNIASRAAWPKTTVQENDRLEVVHFVGGGAATLYR